MCGKCSFVKGEYPFDTDSGSIWESSHFPIVVKNKGLFLFKRFGRLVFFSR